MLKVVFISRGWWPNVRGGSERFVYRVSTELFRRGYEVVGIHYRFPEGGDPEAPFKLITAGSGSYSYFKAVMFSRNAAKKVKKLRPDVVIINGYWSELTPVFIRGLLRTVYLVHDVGFVGAGGFMNRVKSLTVRYSVRFSNVVVVPTKVVRDALVKRFNVDVSKVRVIGFEGVDAPFRRIHADNKYFDIVQVGRYSPNKGHLIVLEAFKHVLENVRNARLWLVGGSNPKGQGYLERVKAIAKSINEHVGREAVKVVVNAPSVDEYYRVADVCVAASTGEEGFGLSVAECMAYGKPVVVSDIFLKTGVVSEDSAVVVPRGDSKALANALMRLYEDNRLRRSLIKKALERSRMYRWERVADVIERIIKELL